MTKYNIRNQDRYLLQSNLLGARNIQELEQLERVAFYLSITKLENEGFYFVLPLTVDSVTEIHRILFSNIYSFAGEIRDVSLVKDNTRFCEPQFIKEQLNEIIKEINEEETWDSLAQATERLVYYKTELNMIHPFREGNGRIIRLVIREIAKSMGYSWHFETIEKSEYLEAMISSQTDTSLLEKVFQKSLYKMT